MSYVLYPGMATSWIDFVKGRGTSGKAELERFRDLATELKGGSVGIRLIGPVGITSHYRDIAQMASVPVIFAATKEIADRLAEQDQEDRKRHQENVEASVLAFKRAQRRANLRALVRISGLVRDEQGNPVSACIEHLESARTGLSWAIWQPGKRLCLNGFRIELRHTRRAGPHLRIGAIDEDGPRDDKGYRINPAKFLATVRIPGNGVLVLKPHDPIEPAYFLESGRLPEDADERDILRNALIHFYGTTHPDPLIRGEGDRYRGQSLEYGMSRAA